MLHEPYLDSLFLDQLLNTLVRVEQVGQGWVLTLAAGPHELSIHYTEEFMAREVARHMRALATEVVRRYNDRQDLASGVVGEMVRRPLPDLFAGTLAAAAAALADISASLGQHARRQADLMAAADALIHHAEGLCTTLPEGRWRLRLGLGASAVRRALAALDERQFNDDQPPATGEDTPDAL